MSAPRLSAILFTLLLAGCASRPEPPGKMVSVHRRMMHVYCNGPEASKRTVILEGANMGLSPFYRNVQQRLEKSIRVCSYDRAGIAWSEPSSSPREARVIAAELHELLHAAQIAPPFVLAGHSLGGLFVVRYAHDYPEDVAGIALLDPTHPDQQSLWPDPAVTEKRQIADELKTLATIRWLQRLGFSHVYNPYRAQLQPLPPDAFEQALYFTHQPSMVTAIMGETTARLTSLAQAGEVKSLGNVPLLVISAGIHYEANPDRDAEADARLKNFYTGWEQLHRQYLTLSTQSRQVVVKDSRHVSLVSEPVFANQVGDEILKLAGE